MVSNTTAVLAVFRPTSVPAKTDLPLLDHAEPSVSFDLAAGAATSFQRKYRASKFRRAKGRLLRTGVRPSPNCLTIRPSRPSLVLDALIYRPSVFRRNEMRWISVFNWRAGHKANGLAALRRAKQTLDRQVISEASVSIAALACELFGDHLADAVTNVPCGNFRRPDCFGKQRGSGCRELTA